MRARTWELLIPAPPCPREMMSAYVVKSEASPCHISSTSSPTSVHISSTTHSLKRLGDTPPGGKHPVQVARRNERERKRVQQVNNGFVKLRNHVPVALKNKKLSKVETLRQAAAYIAYLETILKGGPVSAAPPPPPSFLYSYCSESELSPYAAPSADFLINNCNAEELAAFAAPPQKDSPSSSLSSSHSPSHFDVVYPDSSGSPYGMPYV